MVHITVNFECDGERWSRGFDVDGGATLLDLKRAMLDPPGAQEDLDSFELRRLGRRVPDFEKIHLEHALDFAYLGPDFGAERAREDVRLQGDWVRQRENETFAAEAQKRRRAEQQEAQRRRDAAEAEKAAAAAAAAAEKAARRRPLATGEHEVVVTIDAALGLTMSVQVSGGSTVQDVKEKLAAEDATGATKADAIGLAAMGASGGKADPLPDATVLTYEYLRLQTLAAPAEENFPKAYPAPRPQDLGPPPASSVGDAGWVVVGGVDKGGILVRAGQATSSAQLPDRLATGSVVEEVALQGERLHYRRLTGAGPETGWVSLTAAGKKLMERRTLTAEDLFTLERALALQEQLLEGFAQPAFQRELARHMAEHPSKTGAAFLGKRRELALSVQSAVLPRFGFEGNDRGVANMMAAFGPRHQHDAVGWNNGQIQMLLHM